MKTISEQMKDKNQEVELTNSVLNRDELVPYSDVDIRFTEFCEWITQQDQKTKDIFYLTLNFSVAYMTKFIDPIIDGKISENGKKLIKNVEEALKRLGLEKLMEKNNE